MTNEQPPAPHAVAELLQQRLDSATELLPISPPLAQNLRETGRRRRRRRRIAQSVAAVVATAGATTAIVLLAAAPRGSSGTAPAVVPESPRPVLTIPWVDHIYRAPNKYPIVRPDPSLAPSPRTCSAGSLQVTGAPESGASTFPPGTVQVRVVAKNVSPESCELTGEVFTRVLSSAGTVLVKGEISDLVGRLPQPALLPGALATTTVHWVSWCGPPVSDWKLLVALSETVDRTYVPVPLASPPGPPPCRYHQSAIAGGVWTVLNELGQPKARPIAVLEARIEQESITSRAGAVFGFSVLVTNPSRGSVALPLHPCPYYATGMVFPHHNGVESLAGTVYSLNCKALPRSLDPGQSVRLLMRMRVPASDDMFGPNRPGIYGFDWNVPDWGLAAPQVRLTLR